MDILPAHNPMTIMNNNQLKSKTILAYTATFLLALSGIIDCTDLWRLRHIHIYLMTFIMLTIILLAWIRVWSFYYKNKNNTESANIYIGGASSFWIALLIIHILLTHK